MRGGRRGFLRAFGARSLPPRPLRALCVRRGESLFTVRNRLDSSYIGGMNAPVTEPLVLAKQDGAVLRLTLNRPGARNALSESLMGALQSALEEAARDSKLRVIVLGANGPAFSSGHDLKEMTARRNDNDKGKAAYAALFAQCSKLMQTVVRHPKPIIAQVQGIATAAGCQLVASCDLAVASSDAR